MIAASNLIAVEGKLDGHENMARDCSLLKRAEQGESCARLYEWDGPWVSLGKFQSAERDLIDAELAPWTIRPTGGKAVLHGHDLTVSVARPINQARGLRRAYREIITPLVHALQGCGQDSALGEDTRFITRNLNTSDCFRHISANDVIDPNTGRKLIGCALRVTRNAVLAQCSIPLTMPVIDPSRIYANAHVALPLPIEKERLTNAIVKELNSL